MASLFKQITVDWLLNGKRVASGTPGAQPVKRKSRKWYGEYRDHTGKKIRVPLAVSKAAAEKMLADRVKQAEDILSGRITEQQAKFGGLPLVEQLDQWQKALASRGTSRKHVSQTIERVRKLVKWCEFVWPNDLSAAKAQEALAEHVCGTKTRAYYVREAKAFSRWLSRRIGRDVLAELASPSQRSKAYERRPLEEEELRSLLGTAAESTKTFRALTGTDRHYLYLTAVTTGYRVKELAALYPANFCLDETPPVVVLSGEDTKNERLANQPLNESTAEVLREWLATKPANLPVWPGSWWSKAAKMLRIDLDDAGIEPVSEGPTGVLHLDFHSLRHTFVNFLDRAGVSLKEAMQLARHSDPRLTMAIYGRSGLRYLAQAVDKLPDLTKKEEQKKEKT